MIYGDNLKEDKIAWDGLAFSKSAQQNQNQRFHMFYGECKFDEM